MSATAPLRFCATNQCPQKVTRGHCPQHTKARSAERRLTMDPRYGTQRWRRYSERFRAAHPFCGCGQLTEVVDHIHDVATHPELFWEETNHRPSCQDCNKRRAITASGGGFGR